MGKYIDAAHLREEIRRLYDKNVRDFDNGCNDDQCYGYDVALSDLQRIIDSLQQEQPTIEEDWVEKRKQECGYRKLSSDGNYQCERYEGVLGPCDGQCSWVIDYPKLKELEEMKQPEVDLDKEIDNYFYPKNFKRVNDGVEFPGWHVSDWKNPNVGKKLFTDDLRRFARHFYELRLNIRKEEN